MVVFGEVFVCKVSFFSPMEVLDQLKLVTPPYLCSKYAKNFLRRLNACGLQMLFYTT